MPRDGMYLEAHPAFCWAAYRQYMYVAGGAVYAALYGVDHAMRDMHDFAQAYLMGGEL